MTQAPTRHSESAFRFYEKAIAQIVARHPEPTTFVPQAYRRTYLTFLSRLRDAINSLAENHWPTSLVDMQKFDEIYDLLRVSGRKDGTIIVGTTDAIRQPTAPADASDPLTTPDIHVVVGPPFVLAMNLYDTSLSSPQLLDLVCFLAHHHLLTRPLEITIPDSEVSRVSAQYDILLERQPAGTYILI